MIGSDTRLVSHTDCMSRKKVNTNFMLDKCINPANNQIKSKRALILKLILATWFLTRVKKMLINPII